MTGNDSCWRMPKDPPFPDCKLLSLKLIYFLSRSLSLSQSSHIVTVVEHVTPLYLTRSPITLLTFPSLSLGDEGGETQ